MDGIDLKCETEMFHYCNCIYYLKLQYICNHYCGLKTKIHRQSSKALVKGSLDII